jgi:hypothetical protein
LSYNIHTQTYTQTHTHTHIHTYTYTYIYITVGVDEAEILKNQYPSIFHDKKITEVTFENMEGDLLI